MYRNDVKSTLEESFCVNFKSVFVLFFCQEILRPKFSSLCGFQALPTKMSDIFLYVGRPPYHRVNCKLWWLNAVPKRTLDLKWEPLWQSLLLSKSFPLLLPLLILPICHFISYIPVQAITIYVFWLAFAFLSDLWPKGLLVVRLWSNS